MIISRISKIMRCFINLFYLAVQSKLVLTLTKSENGLWVLGLSGFIMGSWTFSSLTLSITSFDFLSLVSCLQALWGSSSSLIFLLFPVSSFSLRLTIWAVHLMWNSFTLSRPMRFLKRWFVKASFMKSKYDASNCSYWWLCTLNIIIVLYRKIIDRGLIS